MVFINSHVQNVNILDAKLFAHNFYVWEDVDKEDMICILIYHHIIVVTVDRGSMIRLNKRNSGMPVIDYSYLFVLTNLIN